MKLEDIPKEELQEEAKFIAAVVAGLKQQPEGQIVMIDCPCGGKMLYGWDMTKVPHGGICSVARLTLWQQR